MRILTLILFINFLYLSTEAQSLTKERIKKLKECVVKITIENSDFTGTGFFVDDKAVVTCWHVIDPSIRKDELGRVIGRSRIFVTLNNSEKIEYEVPTIFFMQPLNTDAVAYDFCALLPVDPNYSHPQFLKLGKFENIEEGDQVYTSGYPLGLPHQFISRGTLSTKYIESIVYNMPAVLNASSIPLKRATALLDLTLNKGNSGGPIMKLGATIEEDEIIGIADFLINPFGSNAEKLNEQLQKEQNLNLPSGTSLTESMKLFSAAIIYSSNGISGCISIDHFLKALRLTSDRK